jgi:hypothetical protein
MALKNVLIHPSSRIDGPPLAPGTNREPYYSAHKILHALSMLLSTKLIFNGFQLRMSAKKE